MAPRCVARLCTEVTDLLHWSMLAASTIGPGTIIVCSKAGADYGLDLLWALLLASFVAYTLQEGAAKLSIVSRLGLGQAMRRHFGDSAVGAAKTPAMCVLVAVGIVIGNFAYEANNFVGGNEALMALSMPATLAWRVAACVAFGVLTMCTLFFGDADRVSMGLGVVVIGMTVTFFFAAFDVGAEAGPLMQGLFVPRIPDGGSVVAVSMVATTALPFNSFLASSAAQGHTLSSMRRGVSFSTAIAALLSSLVVIAGTGVGHAPGSQFAVSDVTETMRRNEGPAIALCFAIGLYAAAFSSALTVALGASLTAQSLLAAPRPKLSESGAKTDGADDRADDEDNEDDGGNENDSGKDDDKLEKKWHSRGLRFRGVISLIVLLSIAVGASGMPTVMVVILAQVVNGLLLPAVAVCLLFCLEDGAVMPVGPGCFERFRMLFATGATLFLAAHALSSAAGLKGYSALGAAALAALAAMLPIGLRVRRLAAARRAAAAVGSDGIELAATKRGSYTTVAEDAVEDGGGDDDSDSEFTAVPL